MVLTSKHGGIVYSDLGDFLTSLHYFLKAYYLTIDHPEFEYHYAT